MNFDILLIIIFTSVIQSIFGTGVLLFGTPLLLLLSYDFNNVLLVLLPTSIIINFFQISTKIKFVDFVFLKKLFIYSIPFVIIFLYFINSTKIDINLIIGFFLILIALKEVFSFLKNKVDWLLKNESLFLILTGIIHGSTNLGGALLSSIIFNKKISKEQTRATIAICYLTFAIFQLITISLYNYKNKIDSIINYRYWILGLITFLLVEKFLYLKINEKTYLKYFTIFLLSIGSLLILKNGF